MEDFINLIKESSKRHPALTLRSKDLISGLLDEVSNGNINVTYHPDFPNLAIFKYSQQCVIERNWNIFTIIARGLILDLDLEQVIATPFLKFWNCSEIVPISHFMEKNFRATEKMDGSLGILFFYRGYWRIATCGSFASEQAVWANEFLLRNINTVELNTETTYLLEIVYPENRIVIPYTTDALYLLSAYNNGYELEYNLLNEIASNVGFSMPETYDFNKLDNILHEASILDYTREGFVVRFESGVRVKIKGDEYCRIHKLISRVTPIAIWEMFLNDDDFDEIKKDLPEEMVSDYEQIIFVLKSHFARILDGIEYSYEMTKHLSDKELGLELSNNNSSFLNDVIFCEFKEYIFARRKKTFIDNVRNVGSLTRNGLFRHFRPKGNFLDGYSPSSVMNRFQNG